MGAGLATHYFQAGTASAHLADLYTLWSSFAGSMPSSVTIRIPGSGEQINATTGAVTGVWTGTAPALITGAAAGSYAAGVGMSIRWFTSTVNWGETVVGRTFVVPLAVGAYEADGSILPGVVGANQSAVNAFLTAAAATFSVWSRPQSGTGGLEATVNSGVVVDRTSWLTSRRT
jgi:hypothetical protein